MPQFVIERDMDGIGDATAEQLAEGSRKSIGAIEKLGPGIRWVTSYVTDNKLYCIYFAPDEETLIKHAEMVGIPANRISRVRGLLDPADYT